MSRNTRHYGVFNMVVSDLLEKGLEAFLNELKGPISSVELYEQLELKSWSINWRYESKRPTYKWHGLVTTVLNIEESPGEPLEPSGGWDLDLAMNNDEPHHEVFYMAYKLMEERRVPKGIVHDNLVENVVLGQKVKVRSSALYFYGGDLPDESSECHWRISRWWHSYGDFPWCITRQNCPCDDCEKYRGAAKEEYARRLRKSLTPAQRRLQQMQNCSIDSCNALTYRASNYCLRHQPSMLEEIVSEPEPEPDPQAEANWWEEEN